MKVYRAIPDTFYTENYLGNYLGEKKKSIFEDIYYSMGYTAFNELNHNYNTIHKNLSDDEKTAGKYFFLFAEDAIWNGMFLLKAFHEANLHTFMIVEYDVLDELVLKHIGSGDYKKDVFENRCMECFLTKDDIEGSHIFTSEVSEEEKHSGIFNAFQNSLNSIISYDDATPFEEEFYRDYFNVDNLASLISDPEKLEKGLVNSPLYTEFMNLEIPIVKTPLITGKVFRVNEFDEWDELAEPFELIGERFKDYSEQRRFKRQLIGLSSSDNPENKEKIKTLLKEKQYM